MKAVKEQMELANKDFDDADIASYASNLHNTAPDKKILRSPDVQEKTQGDYQIEVEKFDDNSMHPHAAEAIKNNPALVKKFANVAPAPPNSTKSVVTVETDEEREKRIKKEKAQKAQAELKKKKE